MRSTLYSDVQTTLGPFLSSHHFVIDEVDEHENNEPAAVYYRSRDCKLQFYHSPRNGERNCMLATLDAPNENGNENRSGKWYYVPTLTERYKRTSIDELLKRVPPGSLTPQESLTRIKRMLEEEFEAAHAALLKRRI